MKKTISTSLALLVAVATALAQQLPLSPSVSQQIQVLQSEKANRTAAQKKMDSRLVFALKQRQDPTLVSGFPTLKPGVKTEGGGGVLVDIDASVSQALLDTITAAGGAILFSSVEFHSIRAVMPLEKMESVAARDDVKFVSRAIPSATRMGSVTSEGDVTHQAAFARDTFGIDGSGVNVGVLSDSDDNLAQSQSTGDLPPNVTVLPGQGGSGTGEGTAMMEIVYDLAPGANLFFATADNGPASFAQNILNLRAAGCDIICDDVFYFNESPFQDGVIGQAADRVARDGALYFSACGNEGNLALGTSGTWEGDFMDGGAVAAPVNSKGGNYHMFGTNNYNVVTGQGMGTVLLWSDPLGASTNDYDLYVLDSTGATVVDFSTTTQNGSQDPFEYVSPPNVGERIVVVKASGDSRFLHLDTIRGRLTVGTAGNVTGHAVAANVYAVAAVDVHTAYPNPFTSADPVETFSSDGPRRMFYKANGTPYTPGNVSSTGGIVRQKPDIAAADGGSTSLPYFNPFYGTSAAAPHAAAIAALLKSYNSDLTTDQMRSLLTETALDNMAQGVDINSGWGIIMPYPAIATAPLPVAVPKLRYMTNVISGGNGNGMIDFDECNNLSVSITNRGLVAATGVRVTLTTATPGVFVGQATVAFPDVPPSSLSSNRIPFQVSTTPDFVCGTRVDFNLVIIADQGAWTNQFQVSTGVRGKYFQYDNNTDFAIPDADMTGIVSDIIITNFNGALAKVGVSLFIEHTFDSDLEMELIGPNGRRVILSQFNGQAGNNYGLACDGLRTTFDDDASQSINGGTAPFAGTYRPEQPLAAFAGMNADAVNGRWRLHVVDAAPIDTGTLHCWSLQLTPIICTDGGGECSGSDLSVTMTAAPTPAGVGSPLTYTMVVSNAGPSTAKGAYLSQTLPPNCILGSVAMGQGTYTFDPLASLLNCNLGNIPPGSAVTIVVSLIPSQSQLFTSVATVGSLSPDSNPVNNQASLTVSIENAKSDLALSVVDTPDPVLAGGVLTYTMTVQNLGPTTATNVIVTNILPTTVANVSATSSQGAVLPLLPGNNVVVALLGTVVSNGTATVTITCIPQQSGLITATAVAVSDQLDPYLGNNRVTVNTTVGQAADVAVMLAGTPNPAAVSNTMSYSAVVTNRGPIAASSVTFTLGLPSGVKLVSSSSSQGTLNTNQAGVITGSLGTIPAGGQVAISAVIRTPGSPRTLTATASAYAIENDPNLQNNIAAVTNDVIVPAVIISAGSATLTNESVKVDGVIEAGETVTALFQLKSVGTLTGSNVMATLLTSGGVTQPSAAQSYGTMPPGTNVAMPFKFTASSAASGTITASLLVQAGTNLFTNTFTFQMPVTIVFSNSAPIVIPSIGNATPYPSAIAVSGVTGSVVKVTATLLGFTHSYPHDVSALLVDPNGRGVVVMAHVSNYGTPVVNENITLDDDAGDWLPLQGELLAGTYKPTAFGDLPVFTGAPTGTYGTNLITYNGTNPNGRWSLYVNDDTAGDDGSIQGGWNLAVTTIIPVTKVADMALSVSSNPAQLIIGGTVTNWFTVTNSGPDAATQVGFANTLSSGLSFVSSTIPGVTNGQTFTATWDRIISGSNFTFAIVSTVTTNGVLTDSAAITAAELDLNTNNNFVVANTLGLLPSADLAVSVSGPTNSVAGVDATYTVVVKNNGPSDAVKVAVTNYFPASVVFGSAIPSQGSSTNMLVVIRGVTNAAVSTQIGRIPVNGNASITLTVNPSTPGLVTNLTVVSSTIGDPATNNNTVGFVTAVLAPGPVIQIGNSRLITESVQLNGAIDVGETVVLELALANTGSGAANNLSAKLLSTSTGIAAASGLGVATVGDSVVYGAIAKSASAKGRFGFTAAGKAGDPVVLRFAITDGSAQLPDLTLSFAISGKWGFNNSAVINIPDRGPASPYPSSTNISGLTGVVDRISVTLSGLSHSFPKDLNIALVGPAGQSVVLMSHAGGAYSITNVNLTFDDVTTATVPTTSKIVAGTYGPCDCGQSALFTGFPVSLGNNGFEVFKGTDPNGLWSLYIYDDKQGDAGSVASGWTLNLGVEDYVNSLADLAVDVQAPHPAFFGANLPFTVTVTNFGPGTAGNVMVTNTIPTDATLVSVSSSQGTLFTNAAGVVVCNFGAVNAGSVVSMTTVLRTKLPEVVIVGAKVASDATDSNSANNSATAVVQVVGALDSRLSAAYVKGGVLQLDLTGQPTLSYAIEYSTNLTQWSVLSTNVVQSNGKVTLYDSRSTNTPYRFYRAVRLP